MAVVGNLNVRLTARTAPFRKDMDKAGTSVTKFQAQATAARRAMAGIGIAAAGAAAFGLVRMAKESLQVVDAQSKMSRALGLSIDQWRAYENAAKLSGVSNRDLETGFRRLQKNVSDSTMGLSTATRAFDALNLNAADLIKMSPDQQFMKVADAFGAVTEQATRARVAQDLFGRSGQKMLEMLRGGSAGLQEMREEFLKVAGSMSDKDAFGIERLNNAITQLEARTNAMVQRFVGSQARDIITAVESIAGTTEAAMEALGKGSRIGEWLQLRTGLPVNPITDLRALKFAITKELPGLKPGDLPTFDVQHELAPSRNQFDRPGVAFLHPVQRFEGAITKAAEGQKALTTNVQDFTRSLQTQADTWDLSAEAAQRALFKADGATDEMLRPLDEAIERVRKLREEFDKAAEDRSKLFRDELDANALRRSLEGPAERFRREMTRIRELQFSDHLSKETADRLRDRARERVREAMMVTEPREMVDVQRNVRASVQTAIGQMGITVSQQSGQRGERLEEKQLSTQEDMRDDLRDVADALRGLTVLN